MSTSTTVENATSAEKVITINELSRVTIEVASGSGGASSARRKTTSSSSTTTSNTNDLTQLVKTETSSSEQLVTFNEQKKVTIKVLKGTDEITASVPIWVKQTTITTTTTKTSNEPTDLASVGPAASLTNQQSTEVDDPVTISSITTTEEKKEETPAPATDEKKTGGQQQQQPGGQQKQIWWPTVAQYPSTGKRKLIDT